MKKEKLKVISNLFENSEIRSVWDSEKEPEQVVELCKNNIPILKNIKSKDIFKRTENAYMQ